MFAHLDVTVARFGTAGFDAHREQRITLLDEVKGVHDALLELLDIDDEVIAGGYHHAGVGVDSLDVVGCPGNARCGVAASGLEQNLVILDFGQLLLDERLVYLVGNQDDVIHGYNALHAVKCRLQQASSRAEKVDELFGHGSFAEGPKPAPHAAAHDNAISVVIH